MWTERLSLDGKVVQGDGLRAVIIRVENAGVAARAPRPFRKVGDAIRWTPAEVFELSRNALIEVSNVDAVYFQGAVLDLLKVLDQIEKEMKLPVVASNPAMLWYVLSRRGSSHFIEGYGKLLEQWLPLLDNTL